MQTRTMTIGDIGGPDKTFKRLETMNMMSKTMGPEACKGKFPIITPYREFQERKSKKIQKKGKKSKEAPPPLLNYQGLTAADLKKTQSHFRLSKWSKQPKDQHIKFGKNETYYSTRKGAWMKQKLEPNIFD